MSFDKKLNFNDVWLRDVIIGLLDHLNEKIVINKIWADDGMKSQPIPIYYNFGNDSQWMQDFFTDYKNCENIPTHTDGNTDIVPRGIIMLDSINIASDRITNTFTEGYFVAFNEQGILEGYVAELNILPFDLNFNLQIKASTTLESYKIFQAFIDEFYKAKAFYTTWSGFTIPCQAGYPDDYTPDTQFDFAWDDKEELTLEFNLAVESYKPIIMNKSTIKKANEYISTFQANIYLDRKSPETLIKTINLNNGGDSV